jgi:hypothetical protein
LGWWWCAPWIAASPSSAWVGSLINGLIFAALLRIGLREAAGLGFARFARGGWKIYFSDPQYQRDFDRDNGLPCDDRPHELTARERLMILAIGIGLLFIVVLLASAVYAARGPASAFYPGALLALAIAALAAGFVGITGKGRSIGKWLVRSASHAEVEKGHEHMVQKLEEAGIEFSAAEKQMQKPLSAAVGWAILLGFLAVALVLVVWSALRN